jgi:hypothetical protein
VGKTLRHEWFRNRTDADHSGPQDPNTIVYREKVGAVFALVGTEGVDLGLHLVVIDGLSLSRALDGHERMFPWRSSAGLAPVTIIRRARPKDRRVG